MIDDAAGNAIEDRDLRVAMRQKLTGPAFGVRHRRKCDASIAPIDADPVSNALGSWCQRYGSPTGEQRAPDYEKALVAASFGNIPGGRITPFGKPALAITGKREKDALSFRFERRLGAFAEPMRKAFQKFRARRDPSSHRLCLQILLGLFFSSLPSRGDTYRWRDDIRPQRVRSMRPGGVLMGPLC